MEALIAKLNGVYEAIDAELRLYSEKANAGDASASVHLANEARLRGEAHEITARLSRGDY